MSSPLAIAAVTYVLRDLLNKELVDQNVSGGILGDVTATALPPDRIDLSAIGQGQLNLFMYRVSFNQGWREVDQPSFNDRGDRISSPPLAIDLHYLLTSYAANELHTEILLGFGMHFLHKTHGLDRKAIRGSLNNASQADPAEIRALPASELADQIELIKIVPENMSTEEISKVWTAFGSKYRPSVAYMVTVLLIESKESTKTALRVRKHNVYVNPFLQPAIEKIYSRKAAGEPLEEDQQILPGYYIIISGHNLKSDQVMVSVGGIEVPPVRNNIADNQIEIQLPEAVPAGINGVQVIHDKMMGSPPAPHHGTESNIAAFVLCPVIDKIEKVNGPSLKINVTPAIKYNQRSVLLLNEFSPGEANEKPRSYALKAPAVPEDQGSSNEIVIAVSGVKTGDYLIRLMVDGAESQLSTDANRKYISPRVSLP